MSRVVSLAVALLVCVALQCSAEETPTEPSLPRTADEPATVQDGQPATKPKVSRTPLNFSESDVPETLQIAEDAQKSVLLARSAETLSKSTSDPQNNPATNVTAEVLKSRARAQAAVNATRDAASDAATNAKTTATLSDAQRAVQNAKMAAEVAQELYTNETAHPILISEHLQWFLYRYKNATAEQEPLSTAVTALETSTAKTDSTAKSDSTAPNMTTLVLGVLAPARAMLKFAQNAENDAKYVVHKRLYNEMLAERAEALLDIATAEAATAKTAEGVASCKNETLNTWRGVVPVVTHHGAATKAYVHALSAHRIAVRCASRVTKNATKVEHTYYEIRELLAGVSSTADRKTLRMYQSIASDAHANAEECKRMAASTIDYAEKYVKEIKTALDTIALCMSAEEAEWHARVARKASQKALDEMHLALYQLFSATVSLQQVTDAKKEVEKTMEKSKTGTQTEEGEKKDDTGLAGLKRSVIEAEKRAEESYAAARDHAEQATGRVIHIEAIAKDMRQLAAKLRADKSFAREITGQIEAAEKALVAAKASGKQAQDAANGVQVYYNSAKAAADSALKETDQTKVQKLSNAATEAADAAKQLGGNAATAAKKAAEAATEEEREAIRAYEEVKKLIAEAVGKAGHQTLRLEKTEDSKRDGATAPSPAQTYTMLLCVVAMTVLGAM